MASATLKREVEEVMAALPETATISDLLYALEVRSDIEQGLVDADAGRVTDAAAVRLKFLPQ